MTTAPPSVCSARRGLIAEGIRDEALLPFIDYGIGITAVVDSDMRVAENALAEAWHGARLTGQRSLVAYALLGLGAVGVATDRVEAGALLLGASSAMFEELGDQPERVEADLYRKAVETSPAAISGPQTDRTLAAGRLLPSSDVVRLVAPAFLPPDKSTDFLVSGIGHDPLSTRESTARN